MNTFIEAFLMENQMRKKFKCNDMHYYRPEDRKMSPKPSVARIRPFVLQSNNTYMLQPVAVQILGLSNSYVEKYLANLHFSLLKYRRIISSTSSQIFDVKSQNPVILCSACQVDSLKLLNCVQKKLLITDKAGNFQQTII